jgi:hypothetical protein
MSGINFTLQNIPHFVYQHHIIMHLVDALYACDHKDYDSIISNIAVINISERYNTNYVTCYEEHQVIGNDSLIDHHS